MDCADAERKWGLLGAWQQAGRERDEGADDQGRAPPRDARQLVAQSDLPEPVGITRSAFCPLATAWTTSSW
jgi:hypothetical protein